MKRHMVNRKDERQPLVTGATQSIVTGRRALSFEDKVPPVPDHPASERDAYGCVDWFVYPPACPQQRAAAQG